MKNQMTIREVKTITGVSDHALRYYEKVGLLTDIGRSAGGRRYYSPLDVEWIRTLKLLRSTGMPIRKMRVLARLRRLGDAGIEERIAYFKTYREELLQQIEARREAIKTIDKKIARHRRKLHQSRNRTTR
jgi:DNA-binding transcriptional MerR regulator